MDHKTNMTKSLSGTRAALIDAACQLFAQYGFTEVSTRMISKCAKVSQSSVHYHFDTKATLYEEVFRRVFDIENALDHEKLIQKEPQVLQTDDGKSYAIHRLVLDFFNRNVFFRESWKRDLIIREIIDPSPVYLNLVDNVLRLESDRRVDFFYLLKPDGTSADAYFWAHLPDTQGFYYLVNWPVIEKYKDATFMTELQQRVVNTTSIMMIQILNLPIPKMLQR